MGQAVDQESLDALARIGDSKANCGFYEPGEATRLQVLTNNVAANGRFSEADLDETLDLISTTDEVTIRAVLMAMLFEPAWRAHLPPDHRQRITAAITPFLQSANKLDRLSAERVQQVLATE
jgi:hypothetical protein